MFGCTNINHITYKMFNFSQLSLVQHKMLYICYKTKTFFLSLAVCLLIFPHTQLPTANRSKLLIRSNSTSYGSSNWYSFCLTSKILQRHSLYVCVHVQYILHFLIYKMYLFSTPFSITSSTYIDVHFYIIKSI